MSTDHTNTVSRLSLSLAGLMLIAALGLSTGCGNNMQDRVNDAGNLKQIGLALLMYSGDNDAFFPTELAVLAQKGVRNGGTIYLEAGKPYVSPGVKPATAMPASAEDIRAGNTDYTYVGSGLTDDNKDRSKVVILHTRDGAFGGKWINALFIDGHVEGVSAPDIKTAAATKGWQVGK